MNPKRSDIFECELGKTKYTLDLSQVQIACITRVNSDGEVNFHFPKELLALCLGEFIAKRIVL